MTYEQTLEYLFSQLPMYQRIGNSAYKANLNNTIALANALGNPEHAFKSVHVAGTNGKGSSSHMLAAVLQKAGYKTGLYTSPHLKNFTERIRINGKEIEKEFVVDFVAQHKQLFEEIKPSFFEMTVALAFDYFRASQVEIAVVEVGLGGRLDSTNIIVPEVALITNIGFDHMALLGNSLEQIATEKAGIIKPGVPAVISEKQPETEQIFSKKAKEVNADLLFAEDNYKAALAKNTPGCYQVSRAGEIVFPELRLDLLGNYQQKNLAGVLQTVEVLQQKGYNITRENITSALSQVTGLTGLKGRWQKLADQPLTICDTGHNEDGLKAVLEQLQKLSPAKVHFVFGTVNDKDITKILALLPKDYTYYFCQPQIPRALPVDDLALQASKMGLTGTKYQTVAEAIEAAKKQAKQNEVIFIGGSNFVVAEVPDL